MRFDTTIGVAACSLLLAIEIRPLPLLFVRKRSLRKQLRQMGKEREEVRYEIMPECIRIVTEDSETRLPWNRFLKWKEGNGLILVYRSTRYFIPLPVDQFPNDVGDAIRERLQANVGANRLQRDKLKE